MNVNQTVDDRRTQQELQDAAIKKNMTRIKHKIIIMSGKGGVGKSTIATNLAFGLSFSGYKVGIMDTDIHGPSLGKMLGIEGQLIQPTDKGNKLLPIEIKEIKAVTMASLLPDSDAPVIWRGPLKMGAIKQFIGQVNWGNLDYLIVDLPPGTGDEPLSIAQLIPNSDGAIIVTTPQDVALLSVRKSVNFVKKMNMPIVGIVENMSGFTCPHCKKTVEIFKSGGGLKASMDMGIPYLGKIPLDPQIVETGDAGSTALFNNKKSATTEAFNKIAEKIEQSIKKTKEVK